jgi:hypothetical protein
MKRKIRVMLIAARVIAVLTLLALYAVPPEVLAAGPAVCLFRRSFGIECLGCGMTRAVSAAVHLDFARAMDLNRMAAIVLPVLLVWIASPARFWTVLAGRLGRQFRSQALRQLRV